MLKTVKQFVWLMPFACFLSGYIIIARLYPVKEIATPLIIGKTLHEACAILAHNALNIRVTTFKEDASVIDGTILSQTPQQTQKIKPNQTVYSIVSMQPQKNLAPDCIKQLVSTLETALHSKNIRVKTYSLPSSYPHEMCIAQWPAPGSAIENNSMILYASNAIQKPVLVPNMKNKTVQDVTYFLKNNNITYEILHIDQDDVSHDCANCHIIDQRPLAGSIISLDPQKPMHVHLHVQS